MADDAIVRHHPFETAADFLAALRPGHPLWGDDPGTWVFRGHADSRWLLLPSENRRASLAPYFGTKYRGVDPYCTPDPADLGALAVRFVHALNRAGYPVPGVGRFTIEEIAEKVKAGRPSAHVHELIALAQHHGLPTYMLDWSRHSNVAAYFAASETVHLPGELTGEIEVWALNSEVGAEWLSHGSIGGDRVRLHLSAPPRVGNANLHAQSGLFTYGIYPAAAGLRTADEMARAMALVNKVPFPVMHRLRLPQSQAGAVLRLLSFEPVTGGTLFPGVGGVVRDVRDRARFGRKD